MKTNTLIKTSLILGVSLVGLTGLAQSASAFSLNTIAKSALGTKLFDAEGRAGVAGVGDYEWIIGENGANYPTTPGAIGAPINITWQDDTTITWTIDWTQSSGAVNLDIAGGNPNPTDSGYTTTHSGLAFNQFGIVTRALTTTNVVEAGTVAELVVQSINGATIDTIDGSANPDPNDYVPILSTAPGTVNTQDIDEAYYQAVGTPITSISGTAKINWPSINPQNARARSRIFFKIRGYNSNAGPSSLAPSGSTLTGPTPQATPEPSAILGLVAITGLGLSLKFKGKNS